MLQYISIPFQKLHLAFSAALHEIVLVAVIAEKSASEFYTYCTSDHLSYIYTKPESDSESENQYWEELGSMSQLTLRTLSPSLLVYDFLPLLRRTVGQSSQQQGPHHVTCNRGQCRLFPFSIYGTNVEFAQRKATWFSDFFSFGVSSTLHSSLISPFLACASSSRLTCPKAARMRSPPFLNLPLFVSFWNV